MSPATRSRPGAAARCRRGSRRISSAPRSAAAMRVGSVSSCRWPSPPSVASATSIRAGPLRRSWQSSPAWPAPAALRANAVSLGKWRVAAAELEAYRTLSGSVEHLPVLADCYRALRRHAKVAELWTELKAASPSAAVVAEGRIVIAGSLADRGDLRGAIVSAASGGGHATATARPPRPHVVRARRSVRPLGRRHRGTATFRSHPRRGAGLRRRRRPARCARALTRPRPAAPFRR